MRLQTTLSFVGALLAACTMANTAFNVASADGTGQCQSAEQADGLSTLGTVHSAHLTYKRANTKAFRKPAGVRVNLVPTEGMNAPLLLRRAQCQSTNAGPNHPLAVEGITLRVVERGPHFALYIDAPSPSAAREVLQRIQAE